MDIIPQLILQVILIATNAIFACAEIAVISTNDAKLAALSAKGDKRAKRLEKMKQQPARFLATIQVAITLSGFLGAAFAAENLSARIVEALINAGVTISPSVLSAVSVVIVTMILSFFTLVFGELVPKRVAMKNAEKVALFLSTTMSALSKIFAPLVGLLTVSTNGVLRLLGIDPNETEEEVTEDEIRMMIELGGEKGTIDEDEETWIQNVFRFDDITVSDAMTHVSDVVALDVDMDEQEIIKTIEESGLSRYPVYDEDINDILGILYSRDFLLNLNRPNPIPFRDLIRPAYFVPESIHADVLFQDMQQKKIHIAVVVDEYGSTDKFCSYIHKRLSKSNYNVRAKDIEAETTDFDISNPIYGSVCVFTGTLEKMTRKEAMQIVKNLGGENGDSVTKKTNFLILGNNDFCKSIKDGKSSKQKKAEKLKSSGVDIEIISESVFYDMAGVK